MPTSTPHARRFSRFARGVMFVAAALALALPALADGPNGPILHEYVPFDPATDLDFGAVTLEGGFAAEVQTRSGKITAPDVGRPISPKTPMYGTTPSVPDTSFVPDRDTRRVDTLTYDEPFRPRVAPFKRLVALDTVGADYKLKQRDLSRSVVSVGAEVPPREPVDTFYADLAVDLKAGESIRIPSPIAGAVVKRAHVSPPVPFRLERDSAENLFIVAEGSGKARLAIEFDTPRDAFAGETSAYDWGDLKKSLLPTLPSKVQRAAEDLAKEIGIDRTVMAPHQAIRALVKYFREFKDSEDPPPSTTDIYLDLARAKKGVCRHRAFAFVVTALGLGIPSRFVFNEAHAWVEVHDGYLWRRIDLGGAGRALEDKSEKPDHPQPAHDPPPDPYAWPSGATRGSDLVPPSPAPGTTPTGTTTVSPPGTSSAPPSTAPASKVTLSLPSAPSEGSLEILRTKTLAVKGHIAASDGAPCKKVRVEIVLKGTKGERIAGALVSNDDGDYDGKVTIPSDLPLDEYAVSAHTPGAGTCGQGTSE